MFIRFAPRSASIAVALAASLATPTSAWAQAATSQQGAATAQQPVTKSALTAQLDTNFNQIDTNKDKSLNKAEIEAAQNRSLANAKAELDKRATTEFNRLDADKNGQLSVAEFKAVVGSPKVQPSDDLLKQLDRNSDGKIGQDEFRAAPLANFDRLDLNKDGTISTEERAAAQRR